MTARSVITVGIHDPAWRGEMLVAEDFPEGSLVRVFPPHDASDEQIEKMATRIALLSDGHKMMPRAPAPVVVDDDSTDPFDLQDQAPTSGDLREAVEQAADSAKGIADREAFEACVEQSLTQAGL